MAEMKGRRSIVADASKVTDNDEVPATGIRDQKALQEELDRISLVQALTDADIATARVIDLTERLVEARVQINSLRGELEELKLEHGAYRAEQEQMQSSQAFKLAKRLWAIRNALGI